MNSRPLNRLLAPALLLAAVAALVVWIVPNTQWVQIDVPRAPSGKAAGDDYYALQRVLQRIGATTVKRDSLSELPPPGATLLLDAWFWDVFPERDRALHTWVEQGGNLVIGSWSMPGRHDAAAGWMPVMQARPLVRKEPSPSVPQPGASRPATGPPAPGEQPCRQVGEPAGVAPAYAGEAAADSGGHGLALCTFGLHLQVRQTPLWALEDDRGIQVARAGLAAGSVTVVPGWNLFDNGGLLKGDDALIAVAALQAQPGTVVWLVSGAGNQGLLTWLWKRAWIALALGLLALALWLWRVCARFGPMQAMPPTARRSMIEQIVGTASFLWRRSPGALHQAQLRALDEAASLYLSNYARLDRPDRIAAISKATGLELATIRQAVSFGAAPGTGALPRMLAVLEQARRALLERARRSAPPAISDRLPRRPEPITEGA